MNEPDEVSTAPATEEGAKERLSPSQLMRKRHPGLFSDSEPREVPVLGRAELDYHLESLTSRKQENEFELFCRRLAEKEICPNLLPQTGPTGGGDSKVDTETYPVSDEVARRWYVGDVNAAQERWAFAFSAKKGWRDKLKSDVKKVVGTGRSYARIYFITNQYVKDKERATKEESPRAKHGVPVRILDRTWLLEKVFQSDRVMLAVECLGIEDATKKDQQRGPRDTASAMQLKALEEQLEQARNLQGFSSFRSHDPRCRK